MQFDFSNVNIVVTALGLVIAVRGLVQLVTGNPLASAGVKAKYTEESLRKLARPSGLIQILLGLCAGLWTIVKIPAVESGTETLIKTIVIAVVLVLYIVITVCMRKKK